MYGIIIEGFLPTGSLPRLSMAAFPAALSMAISRDKARLGLEQWRGRRPTLYTINSQQSIHNLQLTNNKTHHDVLWFPVQIALTSSPCPHSSWRHHSRRVRGGPACQRWRVRQRPPGQIENPLYLRNRYTWYGTHYCTYNTYINTTVHTYKHTYVHTYCI